MTNKSPQNPKTLQTPDRLIFLIDGVYAITLTLLILDLKLPDDAGISLRSSLMEILPRLAIYLFAFATIVNHWIIHNRTFHLVNRGNNTLVLLSFVNLLFITLIPVSAGIVGSYPFQRLAAMIFTINSLLLCLSAAAIWAYVAANRQLLAEDSDTRFLKRISNVWLLVGLGFVAALAAGFVSVFAAYAIWLLWPWGVSMWGTRRRKERDSKSSEKINSVSKDDG